MGPVPDLGRDERLFPPRYRSGGIASTETLRTSGRRAYPQTHAIRVEKERSMADKSPKKSAGKTTAAKTLKEKRADKKDKAATKRKAE
jgi:hypothetical protein